MQLQFEKLPSNSFEIIKEVGQGAFGKVYQAIDILKKRKIGLKFIAITSSHSKDFNLFNRENEQIQSILQEKEMLEKTSETNNPCFLNFWGIYEANSSKINESSSERNIILSMECGLISLSEVIDIRRSYSRFYSEYEVLYIIRYLIEGFLQAQRIGISHRDIKPANIILCKNEENGDYRYKISDFGSGYYIKKDKYSINNEYIEGKTVKSLSRLYAAPELKDKFILDDEVELMHNFYYDPFKSDVFSLGVVILRMLGFQLNKIKQILCSLKQKSTNDFRIKGCPKISQLLSKMLVIKPENRCTFEQLLNLLKIIGFEQKPDESFVIQELIRNKIIEEKEHQNLSQEKKFKNDKNLIRVLYHQLKDYDVCRSFVNKALESFPKDEELSIELKKNQAFWLEWLAAIEYQLGNFDNSLVIFKKALTIQKTIYGKEALQLSSIKSNQASIYEKIGNFQKALNLMKKALNIIKNTYGEKHNKTIKCLVKISSIYEKQKDFKNCLNTYNNIISIRKELYGEKDKQLAIYINNLAYLYKKCGDLSKSLDNHLQANKILSNYFKESSKEMAISYNNIAQIHKESNEYDLCRSYTEKTLEIYMKLYGKNNENTAECLGSLAQTYRYSKDLPKALEIANQSYEILSELYGEKHEKTIICLFAIAQIYQEMNDYKRALQDYQKTEKILLEIYGELDVKTGTCINNIALIYRHLKEYSNAFNYIQRALNIYLKIYGENHINTAVCYNNVGLILQEIKDFSLANENYKNALEIFKKLYGENDSNTLNCINNIAECYRKAGVLSKALTYFNQSRNISLKIYGEKHAVVSKAESNLGVIYYHVGDYASARNFQIKSLEYNISRYGENHHETLAALNNLAATENKDGKYPKALELYEKAGNISLKINGSENKLTEGFQRKMKQLHKKVVFNYKHN